MEEEAADNQEIKKWKFLLFAQRYSSTFDTKFICLFPNIRNVIDTLLYIALQIDSLPSPVLGIEDKQCLEFFFEKTDPFF